MKEYLLSILAAALTVSVVGMLAPDGSQKAIKLISALFLLVAIAAPLPNLISAIPNQLAEIFQIDQEDDIEEDFRLQTDLTLENASKVYLAQSLTSLLAQKFSIPSDEIRCTIRWSDRETTTPEKVTIILSGSAIWKNPNQIEETVTQLLGCECVTAIE